MIGKLIERPIAVTMSIIAIIVLGAVAIGLLPVSLMPDVDIPQITVQVTSPGTSARELDASVIKPLRNHLIQLSSLKEIQTESNNNSGTIFMQFEHGSDIDFLFIEANEKIDRALTSLPRDLERPKVVKASATDIPAFFLEMTIENESAEKFMQLSRFASEVISKRIEQIPEVALVDISGISTPELLITPDKSKLESLGLSISDLEGAISRNNIRLGNLTIKDGYYQWNIRFRSDLQNRDDIENIRLNIAGRIYLFKELATVIEQPKQPVGLTRSNGKRAVTLAIIKQADAKMDNLREGLNDLINNFCEEYPYIKFTTTKDQTQLLDYSISNLKGNLLIGALLACLVIFLFMQDFRSPALVVVAIPLSLIVSLLFFYLIGISINIISLSGLILGIGMMVDNSIIVIDNITQHRDRGESLKESVVKGVNEVFAPMLSSVLTTCSVFLPLVFLSGIAGDLFYDQAMGVSIGLFSSLLVAVLVIPVYYYLLYKSRRKSTKNRTLTRIQFIDYHSLYEKMLKWVFRHQRLVWIMVLVTLPATFFIYRVIDKSKLPPLTHDDIVLKIDWNSAVSVEENDKRTASIIIEAEEFIDQTSVFIGSQQFLLSHTPEMSRSEAIVYLKAKEVKDISVIENKLGKLIKERYPDASYKFEPAGNIFNLIFSDNEYNLVAKIKSKDGSVPDPDKLNQFLAKIRNRLPDIYIEPVLWQEQILFVADQEMMALHKLSYSSIYQALRNATKENRLFAINVGVYSIPVMVGDESDRTKELLSMTVKNSEGIDIPLTSVVKEGRVRDFKSIVSGAEGDIYPLNIRAEDSDIPMIMDTIEEVLDYDDWFDVSFSGSFFTSREMIDELIIILVVAFLLLFFILAAQFESLIQPFIILSEVLVDIFGAFLILLIFGSGINIMSMIGIVVMCGIVINDSILKVDTINRLIKEDGYSLLRAIIEGGSRRIKPIIMTSLTTVLAVAPFLVRGDMGSDLQFPLSLALIGGMVFGTIVSIFFIPIFYYQIYKKR